MIAGFTFLLLVALLVPAERLRVGDVQHSLRQHLHLLRGKETGGEGEPAELRRGSAGGRGGGRGEAAPAAVPSGRPRAPTSSSRASARTSAWLSAGPAVSSADTQATRCRARRVRRAHSLHSRHTLQRNTRNTASARPPQRHPAPPRPLLPRPAFPPPRPLPGGAQQRFGGQEAEDALHHLGQVAQDEAALSSGLHGASAPGPAPPHPEADFRPGGGVNRQSQRSRYCAAWRSGGPAPRTAFLPDPRAPQRDTAHFLKWFLFINLMQVYKLLYIAK